MENSELDADELVAVVVDELVVALELVVVVEVVSVLWLVLEVVLDSEVVVVTGGRWWRRRARGVDVVELD